MHLYLIITYNFIRYAILIPPFAFTIFIAFVFKFMIFYYNMSLRTMQNK